MSQSVAYIPYGDSRVIQEITNALPDFIEITTPSTVGEELPVAHGLNRVPHGFVVVKRDYSGTWAGYPGAGDTAWTNQTIYLKFGEADVAMTIAVF